MPGSPDTTSKQEVKELQDLFNSPPRSPPKESALPLTRIAKFGVADENRRVADLARLEKEERIRLREEAQQEKLQKAHQSKMRANETNERARLHRDMTRQMNASLVRQIRETEAEWQHERELAYNGFRDEARKRVLMANALDARLDAQEAAVDAEERRIASMERAELMRQVEDVREANLLEKRDRALQVRATTTRAVASAQEEAASAKKMAAAAKRADSEAWAVEKERNRRAQSARASVAKAAAEATKTNLKKSSDTMTTERKALVMRDKKVCAPRVLAPALNEGACPRSCVCNCSACRCARRPCVYGLVGAAGGGCLSRARAPCASNVPSCTRAPVLACTRRRA